METNDIMTSIVALGGVPLILGLVQLFKPFIRDTRYYPLVAVACGLAVNLAAGWALGAAAPSEWVAALFNGVVAGLAASGLYSAGSTMKEGSAAVRTINPTNEGDTDETD